MDGNDPANQVQLSRPEPVVTGKVEGFKPEFAGHVLPLDVNVRRLIAVEACEEESIATADTADLWHSGPPPPRIPPHIPLCLRGAAISLSPSHASDARLSVIRFSFLIVPGRPLPAACCSLGSCFLEEVLSLYL